MTPPGVLGSAVVAEPPRQEIRIGVHLISAHGHGEVLARECRSRLVDQLLARFQHELVGVYPLVEHLDGIEVVKGSGQIAYGPVTVGGVINYLTRYLAAVGETTEVPRRPPNRGPPYWKSRVLRRQVLDDEDGCHSRGGDEAP